MISREYEIARHWHVSGSVSPADFEVLKAGYLASLGSPPDCTTCRGFAGDVLHYYRNLYSLRTKPMRITKYIILGGFLQLPSVSFAIVNEGVENESTKVLTDAMAEEILEAYPGYSTLIVENPNYDPEAAEIERAEIEQQAERQRQADQDAQDQADQKQKEQQELEQGGKPVTEQTGTQILANLVNQATKSAETANADESKPADDQATDQADDQADDQAQQTQTEDATTSTAQTGDQTQATQGEDQTPPVVPADQTATATDQTPPATTTADEDAQKKSPQ